MKKYVFIFLGILILGCFISYRVFYFEKYMVKRIINKSADAVKNENISYIDDIISENWNRKKNFIEETKIFFKNNDINDIEIVKTMAEINNNRAKVGVFAVIKANLENLGEVKGRQVVGLKIQKENRKWLITDIKFEK